VVDDGQTHYEVLGVEPGAGKDDIKAAYQERLDDVQAERTREMAGKKPDEAAIASGRDDEARLRSAWGVLSDPYQRGRYDASAGVPDTEARDPGVDDEDAQDLVPAPNGRRPARGERRPRPVRQRPPGMFSTDPLPTPASWPPGVHPPPPRARVMAMMVDMTVLLVILISLYVAGTAVTKSVYPVQTKQLDNVGTCLDRLNSENGKSKHTAARINTIEVYCSTKAHVPGVVDVKHKPKLSDRLSADISKAEDRQTSLRNKIAPVSTYGLFGAILLLSLLYLVPSSLRTGRTFGKKLFQIRAIQMNGAPLGLRAALTRYGLPLVFALMLQGFLGPLAFAFALIGVLTWPRNANLQGLHDRVAGTIVVDG
jgi:uncharacterized RDD family membrane protein YckC